MNAIQLLPFGRIAPAMLKRLRDGLTREFSARCEILEGEPEPVYAMDARRQQYGSTQILAHMATRPLPAAARTLGIVSGDLYIPILTFVFGEAQLNGPCAVVSLYRLRQEFYGLPADEELLMNRLLKESVHELGHTLGVSHCDDYRCAMAPSHAVEWIDLKGASLCGRCRGMAAR